MTVATLRTQATLEADLGFMMDLQNIKASALFNVIQTIRSSSSVEEIRILTDRIERESIIQHQNALDAKNKLMQNINAATYPDEDAE